MILVDTGPLVAAGDRDARLHDACMRVLVEATGPRLVPGLVVAEVCYLLARDAGIEAEASFLESFTSGFLTVIDATAEDLARAAELVRRYGDLPLGGVDACLVAIAERLGVTTLATIDRRDFSIVRPRHTDAFTLVPELP